MVFPMPKNITNSTQDTMTTRPCKRCGCDLVAGENITPKALANSHYKCKTCQSIERKEKLLDPENARKKREGQKKYQQSAKGKAKRAEYNARTFDRRKAYQDAYRADPKNALRKKELAKIYCSTEEYKEKQRNRRHTEPGYKEAEKLRVAKYVRTPKGRKTKAISRAKRRAAEKAATPDWLNKAHHVEMDAMYMYHQIFKSVMPKRIGWDVDHIVQLANGGEHAPWNLRVMRAVENRRRPYSYLEEGVERPYADQEPIDLFGLRA